MEFIKNILKIIIGGILFISHFMALSPSVGEPFMLTLIPCWVIFGAYCLTVKTNPVDVIIKLCKI
jgi:hypothetical protein